MMQDNPPEEILEEMERIERELAERYEHHRKQTEQDMEDTDQDEDETDEIGDSRITEHTARVDRYTTHQVDGEESLVLSLQTVDGLEFKYIPLPDDPTDETEPLVRLCAYLNVPINQISEIRGEYVPLCEDVRGETVIHIPPIPTTGNLLRYRIERFLRKRGVLVWYDAVEAERERYADRQIKRTDASLGSEEHHDALMKAYEEIGEEDVDQYPCKVSDDAKAWAVGGPMILLASFQLVGDLPWAVDLLSKGAAAIVGIVLVIVFIKLVLVGIYRTRDRLFPKAE